MGVRGNDGFWRIVVEFYTPSIQSFFHISRRWSEVLTYLKDELSSPEQRIA